MDKFSRRQFLVRGAGLGIAAGLGMLSPAKYMQAQTTAAKKGTIDLAIARGGDPAANTIKAVQALGGMARFVKKGNKVAIKPNPITPTPPETAANTNPFVVEAVVKMCVQAGASEVVVLSHDDMRGFEGNGIFAATSRAGGRVLAAMTRDQYQEVPVLRGKVLQNVEIIKDILDADVFINMPIAKHHAEAMLTFSMKNLMGTNWNRGYFHLNGLHQCIADICTVIKHDLVIMDANRILLTNGPSGPGETREEKTVIAGTDPVAVDAFTTSLFNRNPEDIPHIQYGYELGIGETNMNKLNIQTIEVN